MSVRVYVWGLDSRGWPRVKGIEHDYVTPTVRVRWNKADLCRVFPHQSEWRGYGIRGRAENAYSPRDRVEIHEEDAWRRLVEYVSNYEDTLNREIKILVEKRRKLRLWGTNYRKSRGRD